MMMMMMYWLKALAVNWADHLANLYDSLIGFQPRQLKGIQGMSSVTMDLGLVESSSTLSGVVDRE